MSLSTRASLSNDYWLRNSKPKSIFISLHANAFSNASARGTETYVAKNASTTSKNFAKVLNNEIVKTIKKLASNEVLAKEISTKLDYLLERIDK